MKILHFADLHLGVESYGRIEPSSGLSTRLLDFLSSLDKVVDYAQKNKVDLVLFCGDAYKTREPTQTQQREFARRINRLSTSNIPTCSGTIQIASLPWLRRSALLSREESRNLDFDQIKERLQQTLTRAIELNASKIDPSLPSILAAHVWVAGARIGSEKQMTIGQEHVLLLSNVANPAFDYIALGHIHKHQVLSDNPPAVYAGSLTRLDFSDEEDDKGFYLVEIEPDKATGKRQVSFEFHAVSGRRFFTISVALEAQDIDPTATVLKTIAEQEDKIKDAIVRLNITLPAEIEGQLREGDIRDALKAAHYFTIARETVQKARLRLGQFTAEEITPLNALKAWLQSTKVPAERTKVLMEYGEKLIRGEETRG